MIRNVTILWPGMTHLAATQLAAELHDCVVVVDSEKLAEMLRIWIPGA